MSTTSDATGLAQRPVLVADEQIGVNGAIAAALTRLVGSMPALYLALAVVGGWMALATWGPLHRADPYPFPFLLFLDNVVQLVLCLVILVGQRVLGAAADRRAVQTYQNAEAIFERVADLQAHLDRHDKALSRGVSLLETSAHPWIQRHRVQPPPQAFDQTVGVNGRIAAWLTTRLGSMWAFYAAALTQLVWIGLAQAGVQRFDPYPFAFMSFLSTLAQLVFMLVIMVGQDVLGRSGDRRSEQTFLDAEAILHECGRMKARLTAQDRVIDHLAGYTAAQLTEQVAQAMHEGSRRAMRAAAPDGGLDPGESPYIEPSQRPWQQLPEQAKDAHRAQARELGEALAVVGCLMVPALDAAPVFAFSDQEVLVLARLQHERRTAAGWVDGNGQRGRPGSETVPFEQLPQEERARNVEAARGLPALLAGVGLRVLRDGADAQDGPGQEDFTAQQWETLQQALMAAGVLVSLAEGVVDAEEIYALIKTLRQASIAHPRRFIRELTAASTFNTALQPDTRYRDYEAPAVETIRTASTIVARKAPQELADFRAFLIEIATVVADANREGGFFGLRAQARTPHEAAAIDAVRRASGLDA